MGPLPPAARVPTHAAAQKRPAEILATACVVLAYAVLAYAAQLPGVVQAFLVLTWQSTTKGFERTGHGTFARAKDVRKAYLKALGLSRHESRGHAPLLAYTFNPYLTPAVPETAFTLVDDE